MEDLNLNGCWRTQSISNHHRCLRVEADSLHQLADVSKRSVTVFVSHVDVVLDFLSE